MRVLQRYRNLYQSITILPDSASEEIVKYDRPPFDITEFNRILVMGQGLNTDSYLSTVDFGFSREQLLLMLKARANLDRQDTNMEFLLKLFTPKFLIKTLTLLSKDFSSLVTKEYMSQDDNDLISLLPEYDKKENLEKLDMRFYHDTYILSLEGRAPQSYIRPKVVQRIAIPTMIEANTDKLLEMMNPNNWFDKSIIDQDNVKKGRV